MLHVCYQCCGLQIVIVMERVSLNLCFVDILWLFPIQQIIYSWWSETCKKSKYTWWLFAGRVRVGNCRSSRQKVLDCISIASLPLPPQTIHFYNFLWRYNSTEFVSLRYILARVKGHWRNVNYSKTSRTILMGQAGTKSFPSYCFHYTFALIRILPCFSAN